MTLFVPSRARLRFSLLALFSFLIFNAGAQTAVFTTSGSWTCPAGVSTISVECWGGGGAGGGSAANNGVGGGGGGGGYAKNANVSVTAGVTYTVTVGAGGVGVSATAGGNGTPSSFVAGVSVIANGGTGGVLGTATSGNAGGAGGTGNTGATSVHDGGVGGTSATNKSGGGGGGAGSTATGQPGNTNNPGAATANGGGAGAAGLTASGNGNNATTATGYGGGGSGAFGANGANANKPGGNGAQGKVEITWGCTAYAFTAATTAAAACSGNSSTITVTSSSMPSGTYTVTYNLSAPNLATGLTSTMVFTAGTPGTGTFSTASLATTGATTITITNILSGGVTGTVTGAINCNSNPASNNTASITVNSTPAQPSTISTTNATPCIGNSVTYSVTNVGGVTYTWNIPATGWTITSGQGTNSVTYTVGNAGTVSVTPTVGTCSGTPRTLAVAVSGLIPGTYSIGPAVNGGAFTTIAAALTAISGCTPVTGAFTLELLPTYTVETLPLTFSSILGMSAANSITIRPNSAVASAFNFNYSAGSTTFNINGGNYYILDGRPGGSGTNKYITVVNTNNNFPFASPDVAVQFINGAANNTIRYCNLQSPNNSTTSGTVVFSTTTATTGNSNNLIDNCDFSNTSAFPTNYPANAVCSIGTTTTTARNNTGNTISNCTIRDFFIPVGDCNGIYMGAGTTGWTITGNSFYETVTQTFTGANSRLHAIQLDNPTGGSNTTITGNYIGGSAAACTGTAMTIAGNGNIGLIKISGNLNNLVQNNTIANISFTSISTSVNAFIYHKDGALTINNNTMGSQSATGNIIVSSSTTLGASAPSISAVFAGGAIVAGAPEATVGGLVSITNNTIGGINLTGTGQVEFRGIDFEESLCTFTVTGNTIGSSTTVNSISNNTNNSSLGIIGFSGGTGVTHTIANNIITNMVANNSGAANRLIGIQAQGDGNITPTGLYSITGNSISNLSSISTYPSSSSYVITGIRALSSTSGEVVSDNLVYNLSCSASAASSSIRGIGFSGPTAGTNTVARNKIRAMTVASTTGGAVLGIDNLTNGGTTSIENNMIILGYSVAGTAYTTNATVSGIYDESTGGTNNIFYNSVNVTGTGVGNNDVLSSGAFRSIATTTRNVKNNLFINTRSNGTGTGKHYAIRLTSTSGLTAANNDYYSSGTGGVLGNFNGTDEATLAAWQGATGGDTYTVSAAASFIDPFTDLHLTASPSVANFLINNEGVFESTVLLDYDGETRNTYTPDPGFDEFKGTGSWIGKTSTVWELSGNAGAGGNWDDGIVPVLGEDVKVYNAPNQPTINATTGTGLTNRLLLKNPAYITVTGGTLQIYSDIYARGFGQIDAQNGTLDMEGSALQDIPSGLVVNNALLNFVIGNSDATTGVNLSGPIDVYRSLTFTGAGLKLTTNDNLTIKSKPTQTAWVGDLTGKTVTGSVTVERYFSYLRKWQYLSVPTNTPQTFKAAWQEGAASIGINPVPGFGMQITQMTGGTGIGFDAFSPSGPSVKTYVPATNGYATIANTTDLIKTTSGYMTYVRGDRLSLGTPATTTNPTTLRTKGPLYTGNQTVSVASNLYGGVGNLYASAVDLSLLTMSNLVGTLPTKGTVYIWDPSLTAGTAYGLGGFQTLTWNTGTSTFDVTPGGGSLYTSGTCKRVESGLAFIVKALAGGGSVQFKETAKTSASNLVSFSAPAAPAGTESSFNGPLTIATDGPAAPAGPNTPMSKTMRTNLFAMPNGNPVLVDGTLTYFDKFKQNTDLMNAEKMGNTQENISIKNGSKLLSAFYRDIPHGGDTVFVNMANLYAQPYQWQIKLANMQHEGVQAYLKDNYLNTLTTLNMDGVTPYNFTVVNIPGAYAADRFKIVFLPGKTLVQAFKSTPDKVDVVAVDMPKPGITVSPNPVENKTMNLVCADMPLGKYVLTVYDAAGDKVILKSIEIGLKKQLVSVPLDFAAGTYRVAISGNGGSYTAEIVLQ